MTTSTDLTTTAGSLDFWHPLDDEAIDESYLPVAEVAQGSSADVRLRVRNSSDTYTAQAITVATAAPLDTSAGDASGQFLLSADGQVFAAALDLGDLAPQQISDPIWLRRVTSPDSQTGTYAFLLTATAGSWSSSTAAVGNAADEQFVGGDTGDAGGQ